MMAGFVPTLGADVPTASPPAARLRLIDELPSPHALRAELPMSAEAARLVDETRAAVRAVLAGEDRRLLVVVGPCSVHDPAAALDYARWLAGVRGDVGDALLVVMRVYVEKPRTHVGWTGLVHDPRLDGSGGMREGLRVARRLFLDVNALGVPVATEFVEVATPRWLGDLVSWAAVGARTVESQPHRQMASGLDCPVGFKNGTSGDVEVAANAIRAAATPHHHLTIGDDARAAEVATAGNPDCHVVLRGGAGANHDAASVRAAARLLADRGLSPRVMIDCGHGNAERARGQAAVARDVAVQIAAGATEILGVMLESNLVAGRQSFAPGRPLAAGQSITDACIGLDETAELLDTLAEARRAGQRGPTTGSEPRVAEPATVPKPPTAGASGSTPASGAAVGAAGSAHDASTASAAVLVGYARIVRRRVTLLVALAVAIAVAFCVDLATGPSGLPVLDVVRALVGDAEGPTAMIVRGVRLPYAITALLVGAALSLAGAEMQTTLDNPLASPFTLGLSSAATFGAALAIVLDATLPGIPANWTVSAFAFLLAFGSVLLLQALARARGAGTETLVLFGIALFFTFNALVAILQFVASEGALQQLVFWTMGSLGRSTWPKIRVLALVVALVVPFSMAASWRMTALRLGEERARSAGVDVARLRLGSLFRVSLLTATAVAFVGTIAFVGLVGPHIARLLVGEDHRFFLPASALAGALVMALASVASKIIIPGALIPIGLVTALIGVPFFVALLLGRRPRG